MDFDKKNNQIGRLNKRISNSLEVDSHKLSKIKSADSKAMDKESKGVKHGTNKTDTKVNVYKSIFHKDHLPATIGLMMSVFSLMLFSVGSRMGMMGLMEERDLETYVANPASTKCIEDGGVLEIKTNQDGSQYGVCIFLNGVECDEWAYLRDQCDSEMINFITGVGGFPLEDGDIRQVLVRGGRLYYRDVNYANNDSFGDFIEMNELDNPKWFSTTCLTNCQNKDCGDDGCGGSCGDCGVYGVCEDNMCVCDMGYLLEQGVCIADIDYDLNEDGEVNNTDLLIFIRYYYVGVYGDKSLDFNGDGKISLADYKLILEQF